MNFPFIDNAAEFAPLHPYACWLNQLFSVSRFLDFYSCSPFTTPNPSKINVCRDFNALANYYSLFREYSRLIAKVVIMTQFFASPESCCEEFRGSCRARDCKKMFLLALKSFIYFYIAWNAQREKLHCAKIFPSIVVKKFQIKFIYNFV